MKSIVNNTDVTIKQRPFPKLMIHPTTKTIILATGIKSKRPIGMIVNNNNTINKIKCTRDWSEEFVDFEGSVTLSND